MPLYESWYLANIMMRLFRLFINVQSRKLGYSPATYQSEELTLAMFRLEVAAYRPNVINWLDVIEADTHSQCVSCVCVSGRLGVSG